MSDDKVLCPACQSDNVEITKDLQTYDCLDCEYSNWLPGEEYEDEESYQKDDAYYEDDSIWDEGE